MMRFQAMRFFPAFSAAVAIFAIVLLVQGSPVARAETHTQRWYDASRAAAGEDIYKQNCALCHGPSAQSVPHWRERDAQGHFPPPPLDGSAHTWHHPFLFLARQIKYGTPGGQMPGFEDRLSDQEIIDVIAWIQSLWPDRIYRQWLKIQRRSQQGSKQSADPE